MPLILLHYLHCSMATRMSSPSVRRPSLPLTAKDDADLEVLRTSPAHRRALEILAPSAPAADDEVSEAVLLHAVFEAGLAAVRRSAEEEGYAQLAADYVSPPEDRRRMARRRTPVSSGDE